MANEVDEVAPPEPTERDLDSDGSDNSNGSIGVDATRRKWITAMLAGPAVVSLPATASAAAFGSISRCVENLYSPQSIYLHIGGGENDGMKREPRTGLVLSKGNYGSNGYAVIAVVVEYKPGEYYAPDWRRWYANGVDGQGRISFVSETGDSAKAEPGATEARQTLVFTGVDDFGNWMTLNPDSTTWGSVPVTNSCYVSIAPLTV